MASGQEEMIVGTTSCHKTCISNLPTEIIQEIFFKYYNLSQAPVLLLLICRRWHNVALGITSLWTTIRFHPGRGKVLTYSIEETIHMPVLCISWVHLRRATECASPALVRIICDIGRGVPEDLHAHTWLSTGCRSLEICTYSDRCRFDGFANSFRNLVNLEELLMNNTNNYSIGDSMGRFFTDLENHSTLLTKMELGYWVIPGKLSTHPVVFNRLRKLAFGTRLSGYEPLFVSMTNLEELTVITPSVLSLVSFPRLTSLSVWFFKPEAITNPLEMPSLVYLDFGGPSKWLSNLKAPCLRSLKLNCWDLQGGASLVPQVSVRPKSLTIRNRMSKYVLIQLLYDQWAGLEGLYLTSRSGWHIFLSMLGPLAGNGYDAPLCPQLQQCTFKTMTPVLSYGKGTDQESRDIKKRILSMVQERGEKGAPIKLVRWIWDMEVSWPGETLLSHMLGEDGILLVG